MPADHHHQLNLFPLHPENLVEDQKDTHDDDVAYFFSAADGGATTLTGLLGAGTASSSASDHEGNYNNVTNNTTAIALSTLTYAYGGQDCEEGDQQLVRTAMRNKAREQTSEEKWVPYSEVTNSSSGTVRCKSDEEIKMIQRRKRLSLKLDYEEIMNVWCDNIHLEYSSSSQPQVVPDFLHHDDDDDDMFGHPTTSNEDWGTNGGLWKVPEISSNNNNNGCSKVVEEVRGGEWKIGQREASLLRYKEKRQNRLFSKKIRYQVRKLNAENRPRIKGRFVKRD